MGAFRGRKPVNPKYARILRTGPRFARRIRVHNLRRAKKLGYRPGMLVVTARINRGGRKAPMPNHGRSTTKMLKTKTTPMSLGNILEKRVSRRYSNLQVLNSYEIYRTGQHKWFNVILFESAIDGSRAPKGRAERGLTSCGRKNRKLP